MSIIKIEELTPTVAESQIVDLAAEELALTGGGKGGSLISVGDITFLNDLIDIKDSFNITDSFNKKYVENKYYSKKHY